MVMEENNLKFPLNSLGQSTKRTIIASLKLLVLQASSQISFTQTHALLKCVAESREYIPNGRNDESDPNKARGDNDSHEKNDNAYLVSHTMFDPFLTSHRLAGLYTSPFISSQTPLFQKQ